MPEKGPRRSARCTYRRRDRKWWTPQHSWTDGEGGKEGRRERQRPLGQNFQTSGEEKRNVKRRPWREAIWFNIFVNGIFLEWKRYISRYIFQRYISGMKNIGKQSFLTTIITIKIWLNSYRCLGKFIPIKSNKSRIKCLFLLIEMKKWRNSICIAAYLPILYSWLKCKHIRKLRRGFRRIKDLYVPFYHCTWTGLMSLHLQMFFTCSLKGSTTSN